MKFKCLVSGNTVEFTEQHDIEAMLTHPQYEVVSDEVTDKEVEKIIQKATPQLKKRLKEKE
jgi:hypothetical protein